MGEIDFLWVVVVLMAVGVAVVKTWAFAWCRPRSVQTHFGKQGIRGPPYRPFIGNVKEMVSLMLQANAHPMSLNHNILPRVFSFYHHWKKIYGNTFLIWFGVTPRLTVAEPEQIREIFLSKSEFFEKNDSPYLVRQLEGDGLLTLKGEKWAHHRKIISPSFNMENLKALVPVIGETVVKMLEKWEVDASESNSGQKDIDVAECFQSLTEEVITRTTFGISYEDGRSVFKLQTKQMIAAADAFNKVLIPGYRFLPTKKNAESRRLEGDIRKSLDQLIRRRLADAEEGDAGQCEDLLGRMITALREQQSGSQSSNGGAGGSSRPAASMSVQDIVEECKGFFFAGKQTTSNLLTWTTVLLAMHPQWQEAARAEVIQHCGSRAVPTKDSIAKLKTISMILNESLRLYPPAIATIRRAKADVLLGTYRIPAGMELLIPILAVHHDTRLWGSDAAEFNPGRFSDGVARAAKHPMSFLPFGLGPRTCIGQNLALLEAKIVVAAILQRFSFKLSPSYRHAPTVLMLLYPKYGAPITFTPLRNEQFEAEHHHHHHHQRQQHHPLL